jgi:thioredoxin reductase
VLDRGPDGVNRARLLRAWSDDVVLLTDGAGGLDDPALAALHADGIEVDERPIRELLGPAPRLEAVAFADGGTRPLGGLLVATTLRQRSDLAARLGARHSPAGPVAEEAVAVDDRCATSVPGLFAAGDAATQRPFVAGAIESGSTAGAMVVGHLFVERAPMISGAPERVSAD